MIAPAIDITADVDQRQVQRPLRICRTFINYFRVQRRSFLQGGMKARRMGRVSDSLFPGSLQGSRAGPAGIRQAGRRQTGTRHRHTPQTFHLKRIDSAFQESAGGRQTATTTPATAGTDPWGFQRTCNWSGLTSGSSRTPIGAAANKDGLSRWDRSKEKPSRVDALCSPLE